MPIKPFYVSMSFFHQTEKLKVKNRHLKFRLSVSLYGSCVCCTAVSLFLTMFPCLFPCVCCTTESVYLSVSLSGCCGLYRRQSFSITVSLFGLLFLLYRSLSLSVSLSFLLSVAPLSVCFFICFFVWFPVSIVTLFVSVFVSLSGFELMFRPCPFFRQLFSIRQEAQTKT